MEGYTVVPGAFERYIDEVITELLRTYRRTSVESVAEQSGIPKHVLLLVGRAREITALPADPVQRGDHAARLTSSVRVERRQHQDSSPRTERRQAIA